MHTAKLDFDPYVEGSIDQIVDAWGPFVTAMNSVNRAMGRPDLYPFVLAPAVVKKLGFIHDLVRGARVAALGAEAEDDWGVGRLSRVCHSAASCLTASDGAKAKE